jgi:NADH-quinone oxidoreductase subunit G
MAGIVGDLADLEMMYSFKSFFEKCLGSKNLECRYETIYINPNERMNYIFNSSINGIEESDFILLVGTNPRHEATILNARIRKSYIKNKTEIFSIGNPGDLTYPYTNIGSSTSIIKEISQGSHKISTKLIKSKKPLVIIGESALRGKVGEYVFETLKNFLFKNNFIRKDWNALNVLTQQASKVGAIDLGLYLVSEDTNFPFFNKLNNNDFKFLYLLGADNININKDNKFIVYQGSHGDRGAEMADIILPGSAFTEKNGLFINLEGRLQNAYKASYPPGDAREDWIIFKDLANRMNKPLDFKNIKELRNCIEKHINLNVIKESTKIKKVNFIEENILIQPIDYYYTNPISRSSKVMSECRQISKKFLFTGIEKAS